jgi:hypothetical protein
VTTGRPQDPLLWAYVYQIVPPQSLSRLRAVRGLLFREHERAQRASRRWGSRLVTDGPATLILIVTDIAGHERAIDRALAAALTRLGAEFTISEPLAVN